MPGRSRARQCERGCDTAYGSVDDVGERRVGLRTRLSVGLSTWAAFVLMNSPRCGPSSPTDKLTSRDRRSRVRRDADADHTAVSTNPSGLTICEMSTQRVPRRRDPILTAKAVGAPSRGAAPRPASIAILVRAGRDDDLVLAPDRQPSRNSAEAAGDSPARRTGPAFAPRRRAPCRTDHHRHLRLRPSVRWSFDSTAIFPESFEGCAGDAFLQAGLPVR